MKLFYIAAALLLFISVGNFFEMYRMQKYRIVIPSMQSLAGFDAQQNMVPGVQEINQRMRELIISFKQEESRYRSWATGLTAGVTVFTAIAALLSGIAAARGMTKKKATIAVAILTFFSSLLNYGTAHATTEKEEAVRKTEQVRKWRAEMEIMSPDQLKGKLDHYHHELDEL